MNFLKANSYKLTANSRGFTLIELLVVIAIIAVLASLSFVGLQNARKRGNDVAMLAQMNAILPQAQICLDQDDALTNPIVAAGGSDICIGSTTYPTSIPAGWTFNTAVVSSVAEGTFSYGAVSTGKTITCTDGGCSKTGF